MLTLLVTLLSLAVVDSSTTPHLLVPGNAFLHLQSPTPVSLDGDEEISSSEVPVRDYWQYPVGIIRRHWRADVRLTTLIHGRDTLAFRATNSEMAKLVTTLELPDTAVLIQKSTLLRFTQTRAGEVIGHPKELTKFNPTLLEGLDGRWSKSAPPPPTLPRRYPRPALKADDFRDSSAYFYGTYEPRLNQQGGLYHDELRYTAILYGDTLTYELSGWQEVLAMRQLGYTETDTYDLWVTIHRYPIHDDGLPYLTWTFGPMTKKQFDQHEAAYERVADRRWKQHLTTAP